MTISSGRSLPANLPTRRHVQHDVLLGALPHPILLLAEDDRVIYANAAAEVFFEASQALLKRLRLLEIVSFDCPLVALVGQVRRTGNSVNEYGVEIATPKLPTSRIVDLHGSTLPETPELVLIMLQQRSMAQMIERQLTHRAAARTVSGMAAVLAHEIKNPLSGIRGAAQLLEPGLSEDDRPLAHLICNETDRICKLVDRMEVFGDERPLVKELVNVHSVLDHVKRLAETGFAKAIRISQHYDPSLPAVPANRDKLIQASLNLLKNAAEAIHEGGEPGQIIISTSFKPGVRLSIPGSPQRVSLPLRIAIEDNGPGVTEAMKQHLFDPFVTSKRTGSGLGLALVAKIVRDHGGIIECESEPRRTVFSVLLPLQDRPSRPPTRTQGD